MVLRKGTYRKAQVKCPYGYHKFTSLESFTSFQNLEYDGCCVGVYRTRYDLTAPKIIIANGHVVVMLLNHKNVKIKNHQIIFYKNTNILNPNETLPIFSLIKTGSKSGDTEKISEISCPNQTCIEEAEGSPDPYLGCCFY